MAYTFDKQKVEKFLAELKTLQSLTKLKVSYEFIGGDTPYRRECGSSEGIKESCFRANQWQITFYFFEKDGFNKWVEVYVNAGSEIEKQESIMNHWLHIPDEFEFLKRNLMP